MEDTSDQQTPRPTSEAQSELDSREEEVKNILAAGPFAGNRAGAFAFLAILAIIGAAAYFHFLNQGVNAFPIRLDSQLISHAELSLAALDSDAPIAVVPSWPHVLYSRLRKDIVIFAAVAALAAFLWSRSAAAKARRDAFLLHHRLTQEIERLHERIAKLERGSNDPPAEE